MNEELKVRITNALYDNLYALIEYEWNQPFPVIQGIDSAVKDILKILGED